MNKKAKSGLGIAVLGITYTFGALALPRSPIGNPFAPIIYPLILGILLTLCGALQLAIGVMKQSKEQKKPNEKFELTPVIKLIIISVVAAILYGILFDALGYVISTSLFMGTVLFSLNGKDKWKTNILVSIIFSVAVYLLFSNVLSIPLPRIPILNI